MSTYRVEWPCCGSATETEAWEPDRCPFCELDVAADTDDRVRAALEVIKVFGGIDGDHHKMWVIDQVVRRLTGDGYEAWVVDLKAGEDGPDTYAWDEGIAP